MTVKFEELTKQQAYEKIFRYFSKPDAKLSYVQGVQGVQGGAQCVYRAPDGSRCAVGCILPNRLYRPAMDEESLGADDALTVALGSEWWHEHSSFVNFLSDVQLAHDDAAGRESRGEPGLSIFLKRLHEIAQEHALKVVA